LSGEHSQSSVAPPVIERVILLRGVVWQGKDVNAWKMWQDLMRFWPTPFADDYTEQGLLYAHAGLQPCSHPSSPCNAEFASTTTIPHLSTFDCNNS